MFQRLGGIGVFAVLLLQAACAGLPIEDVAYGPGERNQLDFHLPERVDGAPVIVFVHGGRWYRNDKTQIELYDRIEALTDAGFVIASINHTYSSRALWPRQLDDVLMAIEFVKEQADDYGYDGGKVGLWGQSSGSHLALMATLTLDAAGESPVDALVSWYGPTDLFQIRQDRVDDEVPGENERFKEPSPETLLLGMPIEDAKAQADAASPLMLARSLPEGTELPPILMVHGEMDFVISPLQTERLFDELKRGGFAPELKLRIVPEAGHGGEGFEAEVAPAVKHFSKHLLQVETE